MQRVIEGKVFVFDENIDTDQIYPGRYLDLTDPEDVGKHAMEGVDPSFVAEFKAGDIIVASTNLGCGSSREHAVVTLKAVGVGALIADSYGRIFYRNAINLGIPVIVCPNLRQHVSRGDTLSVDIATGKIVNLSTGQEFLAEPFSEYTMSILNNGGIKDLVKRQMQEK